MQNVVCICREHSWEAERFMVKTNAWKAMRILGLFGYTLPVATLSDRVEGETGNRRTTTFHMESTTRWDKGNGSTASK